MCSKICLKKHFSSIVSINKRKNRQFESVLFQKSDFIAIKSRKTYPTSFAVRNNLHRLLLAMSVSLSPSRYDPIYPEGIRAALSGRRTVMGYVI